ncbi:MAG TPA: FadR/GntR family transcriptional regulator [Longimicrobiales bacterium]
MFRPLPKQNLADRLARRIRAMIHEGEYQAGDRLPPIMEMARRFNVGHPSLREALKKLETMGVVQIRHGSGVYVRRNHDVLVVIAPDFTGPVTRELVLDLIQVRAPLELQSVRHAARNASEANLNEMRRLLTTAGDSLDDNAMLHLLNAAYHREIALASGNTVLAQLVSVVQELFADAQQFICGALGPRHQERQEHLDILLALEQRDEELAVQRMRTHLEAAEAALLDWKPARDPLD